MLDNPFSQRINAVIRRTRESRHGIYYPHIYVVKEDGEPALRLWALSALIQDRSDMLPSYQQFIGQLKVKVRLSEIQNQDADWPSGERCWQLLDVVLILLISVLSLELICSRLVCAVFCTINQYNC